MMFNHTLPADKRSGFAYVCMAHLHTYSNKFCTVNTPPQMEQPQQLHATQLSSQHRIPCPTEGAETSLPLNDGKLLPTAYRADAREKRVLLFPASPQKANSSAASSEHPMGCGGHSALGLCREPASGTPRNRRVYATAPNDGLWTQRNSQQFPPSVDTGFQHRLFLLPTSIFI